MDVRSAARRLWRQLPLGVRNTVAPLKYGAPSSRQWIREVMNREIDEFLAGLPPERCRALEVSGSLRDQLPWKSYDAVHYPEFDVCHDRLDRAFDIVICEQVLEHVREPLAAVRNLAAMCEPDGKVLISVPFLVRLHELPNDYWRFTPGGLRILLEDAGLSVDRLSSWGNSAAVSGNLRRWRYHHRMRSLRNDSMTPVMVWAICRPTELGALPEELPSGSPTIQAG